MWWRVLGVWIWLLCCESRVSMASSDWNADVIWTCIIWSDLRWHLELTEMQHCSLLLLCLLTQRWQDGSHGWLFIFFKILLQGTWCFLLLLNRGLVAAVLSGINPSCFHYSLLSAVIATFTIKWELEQGIFSIATVVSFFKRAIKTAIVVFLIRKLV